MLQPAGKKASKSYKRKEKQDDKLQVYSEKQRMLRGETPTRGVLTVEGRRTFGVVFFS